jgi:hypothetical protein
MSVRVAGIDIPIHFRKRKNDAAMAEALGYYDDGEMIIVLRKDVAREQQQHVLWHEIFHACENAAHLELDEDTVERMARMTYAVIRENPDVIAWVTGKEIKGDLKELFAEGKPE